MVSFRFDGAMPFEISEITVSRRSFVTSTRALRSLGNTWTILLVLGARFGLDDLTRHRRNKLRHGGAALMMFTVMKRGDDLLGSNSVFFDSG